jgi:hypothetical protein
VHKTGTNGGEALVIKVKALRHDPDGYHAPVEHYMKINKKRKDTKKAKAEEREKNKEINKTETKQLYENLIEEVD